MEAATMQARMANPAFGVPGAMDALLALGKATRGAGLDPVVTELVLMRASQINGCGVCSVQHPRDARELGVPDEKIWAVSGWRDAPYFDDSERAALALAEAVTRLADADTGVPEATWAAAAEHFDEPQLAALVLTIATVNLWNRLNVATRQVAGQGW